jgi:hypothetical protein
LANENSSCAADLLALLGIAEGDVLPPSKSHWEEATEIYEELASLPHPHKPTYIFKAGLCILAKGKALGEHQRLSSSRRGKWLSRLQAAIDGSNPGGVDEVQHDMQQILNDERWSWEFQMLDAIRSKIAQLEDYS